MDPDAVLDFLDDETKQRAFKHNLNKLKDGPQLDLDAVRMCVQLLPRYALDSDSGRTKPEIPPPHEELYDLLMARIPQEQHPIRIYKLVEICFCNGSVAARRLDEKIHLHLTVLLDQLTEQLGKGESAQSEIRIQECIREIKAFLSFLKYSFSLPKEEYHPVNVSSMQFLSAFVGIDGLDDVAHDTLSALLSLLRSGELNHFLGRDMLSGSIVDQSLWDRLSTLAPEYFTSNSSKVFRTWFQWISQAVNDGVKLQCIYHDLYWDRIRAGLLHGFADQRKYSLAIIRQSLLAAQQDICTSTMYFRIDERKLYLSAYEQYSSLFETIVLDRYINQVQACLPELTTLFGFQTMISARMTTTLLAAALNPKVQGGARKIIGNWYAKYVQEVRFLPWATEGNLFTSTLTSARAATVCAHGNALASVVTQFVLRTQNTSTSIDAATLSMIEKEGLKSLRAIVLGVVWFIMDASGKIFQPAILYLLEGLIRGLEARSGPLLTNLSLTTVELSKLLGLSRLIGLPEISSDLYSIYSERLCQLVVPTSDLVKSPGYKVLQAQILELRKPVDYAKVEEVFESTKSDLSTLQDILKQLHASRHRSIQGAAYAPACKSLLSILDHTPATSIEENDLFIILEALWDEAERREFSRSVVVHLPPLLFHPTCIQLCVIQESRPVIEAGADASLKELLSRAVNQLQALSQGKSYILSVFAKSLRKAAFSDTAIFNILPFEDFIVNFLNDPPSVQPEFLFEVAAAEKLQKFLPNRTYTSYYGQREWHAYAALIDLLRRFPKDQISVARRVLDPPIHIKSKWKNTLQLQGMLLLNDLCIADTDADTYLKSFIHALVLEPWPRYRFLLEWIVARTYIRFPGKASQILIDLGKLDDSSPIHIASLMKLGLLVTPFESEDFATKLATQLNYFSASPKVQIRHEANFAFPLLFDLAEAKDWRSITGNPAFTGLNAFIRRLDKFNASPWTIRTLKLDAVNDFTIVKLFQGRYLSIESPEKARFSYEDFFVLQEDDRMSGIKAAPECIPLGKDSVTKFAPEIPATEPGTPSENEQQPPATPAFLQTKSGFDLNSLHPSNGPPGKEARRPASVILVASLIDNPTNLGGLSRISESFGLEALYINDAKKTGHKDFKATSVNSEKHLPISELKIPAVPSFLMEAKRKGYEVVGIEQTDRSGILGDGKVEGERNPIEKDLGSLPEKCVLVLGSEKGGISPEVLAVIDRCVEIKTVGVTRSLNVQTAGGIAVYEWWREWGDKVS
ncbi:hypothetical protein BKA66DRAFT_514430 [Pyrenochaeta sp. MPI-SDFR-AT-0127]|nr:hypothetical protein BKA66DRAFT_514430 [Pyrenochaeta sp. MPI-SDFR-AT-0127]